MATANYKFGRSYGSWGIWTANGMKVENCVTPKEAMRKTWILNGWGEPKKYYDWMW